MTLDNVSLKDCLKRAFELQDFSLSAPAWLDSARFNIVAKPPAGSLPSQYGAMLQSLLMERFKLAYHRETKVMPAFALVVDKKGLKVKPLAEGAGTRGAWSTGAGMVQAKGVTMDAFARLLAKQLNHPVKDTTGLDGVYDIDLRFVPDSAPADRPPDTREASSLLTALPEQAGLRLETAKLPVEILVVDRIERQPTEN